MSSTGNVKRSWIQIVYCMPMVIVLLGQGASAGKDMDSFDTNIPEMTTRPITKLAQHTV